MFTVNSKRAVGRFDRYYGGKVVELDFQGEYTILTIKYKSGKERKIKVFC